MQTLLTLQKYDRLGRAIGRLREQQSKSWTLGVMQMLYLFHAQIQSASPYATKDIHGIYRNIDVEPVNTAANLGPSLDYWHRPTLRLSAPGGEGSIIGMNKNSSPSILPQEIHPGYLVGIVVGSDDTAVTPADYKLGNIFAQGKGGTIGSETTLDEYLTGDASTLQVYGTTYGYSYYFPKRSIICSKLAFKMGRSGTGGGDFVIDIYGQGGLDAEFSQIVGDSAKLLTTATALAAETATWSTTPDFHDISLADPIKMLPGYAYFLRMRSPNGDGTNHIDVRYSSGYQNACVRGSYTMYYAYTATSSIIWLYPFKVKGTAGAELCYGGCGIDTVSVSDPNASFVIRRNVVNRSGETVNLKECGMYAIAGTKAGNSFPFMIGRDVISPALELTDGQIAAITYTPSITI